MVKPMATSRLKLFNKGADPAPDPRWAIAANTEIWTSDTATLARLASELEGVDQGEQVHGAVIASKHPTGWFVYALRSRLMSVEDSLHFAEFVTVRVFLLLVAGPRPLAWGTAREGTEWRAVSLGRDADALRSVPGELPASW